MCTGFRLLDSSLLVCASWGFVEGVPACSLSLLWVSSWTCGSAKQIFFMLFSSCGCIVLTDDSCNIWFGCHLVFVQCSSLAHRTFVAQLLDAMSLYLCLTQSHAVWDRGEGVNCNWYDHGVLSCMQFSVVGEVDAPLCLGVLDSAAGCNWPTKQQFCRWW